MISAYVPSIGSNILFNLKYTIGVVSSNQYFNKGAGSGYDYQFYAQKGLMTGHDDGNLVRFRKYLVVYDSVNIKNGFLILDAYDVKDSLKNKNIDETEGWSIDKLPFAFDKRKLEYGIKQNK
ncbi:hypothetical protein [Soonwooa purpurea]